MEPVIALGGCGVSKSDRDQKNQAKRTSYFFILLITPLNPVGYRLFTNTSKVITHGKHWKLYFGTSCFLSGLSKTHFQWEMCRGSDSVPENNQSTQNVCSCLNQHQNKINKNSFRVLKLFQLHLHSNIYIISKFQNDK